MIEHHLRVHKRAERLPPERQLAWQLATLAPGRPVIEAVRWLHPAALPEAIALWDEPSAAGISDYPEAAP